MLCCTNKDCRVSSLIFFVTLLWFDNCMKNYVKSMRFMVVLKKGWCYCCIDRVDVVVLCGLRCIQRLGEVDPL